LVRTKNEKNAEDAIDINSDITAACFATATSFTKKEINSKIHMEEKLE
jgi:hypothetical protein